MEFKNVSGTPVELPTLEDETGRPLKVADGGTFTATGDDAKNLQASDLFERTDSKSKSSEKEQ